jgi:hypothetical protein
VTAGCRGAAPLVEAPNSQVGQVGSRKKTVKTLGGFYAGAGCFEWMLDGRAPILRLRSKQLEEVRMVTLAYLALLLAAFASFYGMIRLCERL